MTNSEATRHSGQDLGRATNCPRTLGQDRDPSTPISALHPDLLDDLVAEVPGATPLPDAGQTKGVQARGQNTEPALRGVGLLEHHLHTDGAHLDKSPESTQAQLGQPRPGQPRPTHLVLAELDCEGLLHVGLKGQQTHLQ